MDRLLFYFRVLDERSAWQWFLADAGAQTSDHKGNVNQLTPAASQNKAVASAASLNDRRTTWKTIIHTRARALDSRGDKLSAKRARARHSSGLRPN